MVRTEKSSNLKLYCHRCCTKGHLQVDCSVTHFCQICEAEDHVLVKCLQKKNPRPVAQMVGYAHDELGFYYIPFGPIQIPKKKRHGQPYSK